MEAESPSCLRRSTPWILLTSGGVCLLGIVAVVLWIWMPSWAPEWVVKHSPWVDPVLRAMAGQVTRHSLPINREGDFTARVETWGASAHSAYRAGMESPDPRHRMVSVMAWDYESPSRSPLPDDVREKLCDLALADDHAGVRMYAFFALRSERSPRMSEVRAQGIKDRESDVRRAVVAGLDSTTSELDWQTMSSALNDPDGEVRYQAVVRCRDCGERRAVPRLLKMVEEENDPRIFGGVLSALGRFKVVEAIPVLTKLLEGRQSYRAYDLFRAITKIDEREGLAVRVKILRGPDPAKRAFAAHELGELGNTQAITPLVAQLHDPEPFVVGYVITALIRLKATDSMEVMMERLEANWQMLNEVEEQRLSDLSSVMPMISGHFIRVHVTELLDDFAAMPLTPSLRERLARLRDELPRLTTGRIR